MYGKQSGAWNFENLTKSGGQFALASPAPDSRGTHPLCPTLIYAPNCVLYPVHKLVGWHQADIQSNRCRTYQGVWRCKERKEAVCQIDWQILASAIRWKVSTASLIICCIPPFECFEAVDWLPGTTPGLCQLTQLYLRRAASLMSEKFLWQPSVIMYKFNGCLMLLGKWMRWDAE